MSHFVFPSISPTSTLSITSNLQLITFRFYPLKWEKDVPSKILDDEFTKELSRACEVENFPPETKLQYIRDMFTEMDYKAELKANYKNGFADGEAQSEKKERMAAKKLLAAGVSAELVASCFGMSEEEITEFIKA